MSTVFPANVIAMIEARAISVLTGVRVQTTPLTDMSAGEAVSILPVGWDPQEPPQIGQRPNYEEASIQRYSIMIQALVTAYGQEDGINRHALLSRRVRNMLVRDPVLREALSQLYCNEDGVTETFHRLRVNNQRFLVNEGESDGTLYMSVTDVHVITEVN